MKAAPLAIPEAALMQHVVVLGKTGAGKSSTLRHMVEHLLEQKKRVCIIDPKGDWWGLPSSGSGDGPGFPVVLFGDFKNKRSDVPMDARAGKEVAQIIASSNQACVLGFRGWMPADLTKFWLAFAPELFNSNEGELHLVIDEVHNFAPKGKILSPQAGEMLHWTNRLMSEGRGLGMRLLIASQRPQKVHNDTLTCCETLIAMRVVHPADRAALKDWMDECGDATRGRDILADVASMKTGQAWVWFPDGKFLEKIQFPMFRSFDSFSDRAIAPPKKFAKVDVEAVRKKLARVVEEKEANDPRILKARILELEHRNRDLQAKALAPKEAPAPKEIPIFTPKCIAALNKLQESLAPIYASLTTAINLALAQSKQAPKPSRFIDRIPSPDSIPEGRGYKFRAPIIREKGDVVLNGAISGGKRRMMIALAQRPGMSARQLGVRAGMSSSSGTFGTYLAALRSAGHLEGSRDAMKLTADGRVALGAYEPLPTGRDLLSYWVQELGAGGISRMLLRLCDAHPNVMTKAELGEAAGVSHTSGTFGTYLAKLRSLELIHGLSELKASDELFD